MAGPVLERPHHLASAAREARRFRHLAVGSHFATRDLADDLADFIKHGDR